MLIMPVKIQNDLPAKARLEHENIFVMDETRAQTQNIRPLQILVLNLMPIKEETELQLLRSMSNTPLQIDVTFLQMKSHVSKNTSESHLHKFYNVIDDVRNNNYDGLIENMKNIIEINNEKIGIYKNDNGKLYAVKPICTHLGCLLSWNDVDKTWDCPCHGSRFNFDGKSLYDPAFKDLEVYNLDE